jgi:hypothetical protein
MAAIATLVLADGQATPANHNFDPVNIVDDVAKWADRSGGIAIGFPVVSYSLRQPTKNGSRAFKLTTKVVLPILEVTSPSTATGIQPAPTKAYDLIANVEFVLPERSSLAQRKDLLAYVKNALANAVVTNGVNNFESVY